MHRLPKVTDNPNHTWVLGSPLPTKGTDLRLPTPAHRPRETGTGLVTIPPFTPNSNP